MIELSKLVAAGVHFGHRTSRWSPKMREYIWGSRNGIHLIDVSKTAFLLEEARKNIKELVAGGGQVLWIGTKPSAQKTIKSVALELNMPYVIERWVGGTLTNHEQVKKAVTRLLHLRDVVAKPTIRYKKKEISMLHKEIERLERNIGGIIDLAYPPAVLVIVDARREASAIREASYLGIPVISLVDTNTDPEGVTTVIPGNDDSPRAVKLILEALASAAAEGVAARPKEVKPAKASAPKKDAASKEAPEKAEVQEETAAAKPKKAAPAAKKVEASAPAKSAETKKAEAKPAAKKPAAKATTAKKAPAKKPAAKKPAAKATATKKPAAKTSTAKKPAAKKPAASKK